MNPSTPEQPPVDPAAVPIAQIAPIASLADILAAERAAWQDELPADNTYDLLCRAAERHPDRTALRFLPVGSPDGPAFAITYRSLRARVTEAANAFHRAGIVPGKAVTILLPNLPQTHYALLGAQAAGIASPVNPLLEVEHIAAIVRETGAEALVACAPVDGDCSLWDKAVEVVERCPGIRTLFVTGLDAWRDGPQRGICEALYGSAMRPRRSGVTILSFDEALDAERDDLLVSRRLFQGSDVCSFFHTGGTTGLPKVALHTHLNEAFVAWSLDRFVPRDTVMLGGLPLFHVNGAMVTGLAAFHGGWEVVMLTPSGYRGQGVMPNFWRFVERFRATAFSGVPTIFAALAELPHAGCDITSLRHAFCGAAPLPPDVARRFESATGVPLLEGYGLTEAACVSAINPPAGERRAGSVGLRLPWQQLAIWKVDGEGRALAECAPGETGVVGVCGPNVFPGYLRESDNRGIWLRPGWLNTGDLGHLDADGYLHLSGRAKDLIIRGGHNIDPATIEEALAQHPAVALVGAVGQPDAHAGELPVAYVTLLPGTSRTTEQLLAFARERVPERAAVPVRIAILPEMPLTAIGKIAKAELRHMAAAHVFRQVLADAGIPARLEVGSDLQRGTVVSVECRPRDAAQVAVLLGAYPFPVDIVAGG